MKNVTALLLILLVLAWAAWMSSAAPIQPGYAPQASYAGANGGQNIPQPPPEGAGPAAFLEYANQLQTATAAPMVQATQQARMTAAMMEQRIYTDGLTATAAFALTQHSVDLTATSVAQTATVQFMQTETARQAEQATQTVTAQIAATRLAQTQIAPLIQAKVEAEQKLANTRTQMFYLLAVVVAFVALFALVQYKEYLDDRRTKRADESAVKRVVPREGASPLFITRDEKILDPDKAFFPDVAQPAPTIEAQERVTQRAQAIQMADRVARGLAASPGTHTQNYLTNLATQLSGGGNPSAPQLPPQINVLSTPPAYADDVENRLLLGGEGSPA